MVITKTVIVAKADCRRRRPGGGALSRTPPWIAPARRGAGASAGVGTGPAREQFKTMIKRGWCMAGSGLWVVHCTSLANLHVVSVSARRARRTSSGQSGRARQLHASPLLSSSHLFSSHRFLLSSLVWLIDQPSTHIPCLITNEIVKIRPFQTYVFYTDSI